MFDTIIGEKALDFLHIQYHNCQLADHTVFFCRSANEILFDMLIGTDGTIRLWKFIRSDMPDKQIGSQLSVRKLQNSSIIGVEITEERDLCLYAEQTLTGDENEAWSSIIKLITDFSFLIKNADLYCK